MNFVRLLADTYGVDGSFGTLQCTLLDQRSSAPLEGARVTCIWRDQRVSTIKADGRGTFVAQLPEGVYDLAISAHGYLSLFVRGVGVLAGYHQRIVRALVPGTGKDLAGEPSTAIAGYVSDRVGGAVADAIIHINGANEGTAYTTRTDRRGAFVVHGVRPGMYDLVVRSGDRTLAHEPLPIAHVKSLVRRDLRLLQA